MTDQTHRGLREDAAKKRREYLRKKAVAHILTAVIGVAGCFAVLVTLAVSIMVVLLNIRDGSFMSGIGLLMVIGVPTLVSLGALGLFMSQSRKASAVPYVPPVAEQIAALPADAILLRGSDQPTALPGELLRAAHEGTETVAEEMLRASSVGE